MPVLPPVLDSDSFPPVTSEREGCHRPTGCVCAVGEACQFPKLMSQVPAPRDELEMPDRGE